MDEPNTMADLGIKETISYTVQNEGMQYYEVAGKAGESPQPQQQEEECDSIASTQLVPVIGGIAVTNTEHNAPADEAPADLSGNLCL